MAEHTLESDFFSLVLASGGNNVSGTAAGFTIQTQQNFDFRTGDWECCLSSISYPARTDLAPGPPPPSNLPALLNNSIFVSLNILELSPVNNDLVNLLWHSGPVVTAADPTAPVYFLQNCTIPPWRKVRKTTTQQFEIALTYNLGYAIPVDTNDYTTIELLFRKQ